MHEAIIAGCLTAALLLLFLGNWRSTAIIAVSIPLSILVSLITLHLIGETINIMSLGGLALAVGILVDDATVEIENVERHLHMGKDPIQAILDGAQRRSPGPALVATLCICIVFVPMLFLPGVAGQLFKPLALARGVRDAGFLRALAHPGAHAGHVPDAAAGSSGVGMRRGRPGRCAASTWPSRAWFERFRQGYTAVLAALLKRRLKVGAAFLLLTVLSSGLFALLGRDFFPGR